MWLWVWPKALVVVVPTIATATAVGFLVAQSTVDQSNPWAQIGIGALIAAPAYGAVTVLWQQSRTKDRLLEAKDQRIQTLQEDRVARERLLIERLAPQLAQAADLLSRTPPTLDRTFHTAESSVSADEFRAVTSTLQDVLRQLRERPDVQPDSRG